jgi:hypothetical protein
VDHSQQCFVWRATGVCWRRAAAQTLDFVFGDDLKAALIAPFGAMSLLLHTEE